MKQVTCVMLEPSDLKDGQPTQAAFKTITHTAVVLDGADVIKNRYGKITRSSHSSNDPS